ncbi:YesL family protein [Listeria ilorinensis]|uniref:YesL family protein n=1 Tax=Listeria ilorinensis TaxID=2867439 RepID=UPI001EF50BBB|nr:YesL family protein [Listeria ilorinensis]
MQWVDKFSIISDWIIRIVWTNIIWVVLTLMGGIILGLMPATVALFTVTRKWTRGDLDAPIWRLAFQTYKQVFWSANLAGLIFLGLTAFLYIDLRIVFTMMHGLLSTMLYFFLMFLLFVTLFAWLQYFAIFTHFKMKGALQYVVQAFLFVFTSLKTTLFVLVGLLLIGWLFSKVPAFILFASGTFPAYWIMKVDMPRFKKMEEQISS